MSSEAYIEKEENSQRKPVELYEIWRDGSHFYHTGGDIAVDFDSHVWEPATISRGAVQRNNDMKTSEMPVTFEKANPAISEYLAGTPINLSWIKIFKLFRDQDPLESQLVFVGQILSVALKGGAAQAQCAGIEYLLQQPLLQFRYQAECNHTVFDDQCGLASSGYEVSATVTVDSTGYILTATEFGLEADGYFTLGTVEWDGEYRLIADHTGNTITIMSPFIDFLSGETVTVLPGCDGDIDTCENKFSNLTGFFGFPFIPIDNPATWIRK